MEDQTTHVVALRMFLNIWRQILFPRDLMMMLFWISAQLSVEPLIAHACGLQLPARFSTYQCTFT